MKSSSWITLTVSALASASIWLLTAVLTNHREPWDTDGIFYIAALSIAGAVAGALAPRPFWAHYTGSFVGQLGYELIVLRVGPLVLIGAVFLLLYCAIFSLAAALAVCARARLAKKFDN